MQRLLESLPFGNVHSVHWPLRHTRFVQDSLYQLPAQSAELMFYSAVCHLESGDPKAATETFERLLDRDPETALRSLVRFYLIHIAEKMIDAEPPSNRIPITGDMFQTESPNAKVPAKAPKKQN